MKDFLSMNQLFWMVGTRTIFVWNGVQVVRVGVKILFPVFIHVKKVLGLGPSNSKDKNYAPCGYYLCCLTAAKKTRQ